MVMGWPACERGQRMRPVIGGTLRAVSVDPWAPRNSVQNVVSQFSWQAVKPRGHVHLVGRMLASYGRRHAYGRYTVAQVQSLRFTRMLKKRIHNSNK
jgi:hypothetical protein